MQDQNSCHASELGLKKIGSWAGPIANTSSPNEVIWNITIYSSKAHPDMPAAYLVIKRSSTLRSNVATRPVAMPGKRNGEWMEFLFPNTKEKFRARKLLDGSLEIIQENSAPEEKFSLPASEKANDLIIYGESCKEWKLSFKNGRWSQNLWKE